MLEEVLIQGMRNLQSADERECRDLLTAIEDFDELDLEEANVRFETVALPHLDGEEVRLFILASR